MTENSVHSDNVLASLIPDSSKNDVETKKRSREACVVVSQDGRPKGREARAELAGAKLIGGLQHLDIPRVNIETDSVYGAVILMPQLARSLRWHTEASNMVVTTYIYHCICVFLHGVLLMYIDKEQKVMDSVAGQMFLCDFGADEGGACDEGEGQCLGRGPGGTLMTPARTYNWGQWITRVFVRDSFKAMFPDRADDIDKFVDPGEYGMESHFCRMVCIFVFVLSIVPELLTCVDMARLLWYVPNEAESWIDLKEDDDEGAFDEGDSSVPAERLDRRSRCTDWLNHVSVNVAGMSIPWKIWNVFFVFIPKGLLTYFTAKLGVFFLMETASVDNIIVNSVALGFLLGLDELITQSLLSAQATAVMDKCQAYEIRDGYDQILSDEQILENFESTNGGWTQTFIDVVIKRRATPIKFVIVLSILLPLYYYHENCMKMDGRWVSKPIHLPKSLQYSPLNMLFPEFKPVIKEEDAYWSMPEE